MCDQYFNLRNVVEGPYVLPGYLDAALPECRNLRILDIGCGLGSFLQELVVRGYTDVTGVDISDESINACLCKGLNVKKINSLEDYCRTSDLDFDFILMSHVLEHIEKSQIVETLIFIRENLLSPEGSIFLMVPNAQSNTGCYWAYEDFTHQTLFTAGSLSFVLSMAGFASVTFVDPDGLAETPSYLRWLKLFLLKIYKTNIWFWNRVTNSSYHEPSPQIHTYELKVLAKE